ncbi:hypothetical protein M514_01035 [Trichuris suis]|uniref:ARID domain-containing protein n=1 Tax=Trichuris suis TaxID=68888 RepID=A0A085NM41_9BILA|nr:hypothetical protein M514_01035 [Trichuris suis]
MTSTSSRQFAEDEEECDLRRSFNAQLEAFLRRRCNGIVVMPSINGRRIDLYRLYRKVVQMGGWTKVSSMGKWNQVLPVLGIGSNCLCGDYGARTIYMRYLARYEQKQLFGSESDDDDEFSSGTGGVRSGRGRSSNHYFSASRLPDVSSCSSRVISEAKQERAHGGDILRSLQSGLPSEVDRAISTCLLLSSRHPSMSDTVDVNALVSLMLAHIGIFDDGPNSYRSLYQEAWLGYTGRRFVNLWYEVIEDVDLRRLLGPPESAHVDIMCKNFSSRLTFENDVYTRMEQASAICTPLESARFMTNLQFRYVLLAVNSSAPQLAVLAFDLLSNIADHLVFESKENLVNHMLFRTFESSIYSPDRFFLTRTLEVIGKMSINKANEDMLLEFLDSRVVERLTTLLCIKDVLTCVTLLECLLTLTNMGYVMCGRLAENRHLITLLVALLTVEAASFAPEGLTGMAVVEYNVPAAAARVRYPNSVAFGHSATDRSLEQLNRSSMTSANCVQRPLGQVTPTTRFPRPMFPARGLSPRPSSSVVYRPPAVSGATVKAATCVGGRPTLPRAELFRGPAVSTFQDHRNEAAAIAWIKEHCAADGNSIVSRGKLYASYVRCMASQNVVALSANIFSNLIRQVFPSCVFRQLKGTSGKDCSLMQVEGLRFLDEVKAQHPLTLQMLGNRDRVAVFDKSVNMLPNISRLENSVSASESLSLPNTPESFGSASSLGEMPVFSTAGSQQPALAAKQSPCCSPTSPVNVVVNAQVPNGSSPACQFEVCHPAEEATALVDISEIHEARIVRIENKVPRCRSNASVLEQSKVSVANGETCAQVNAKITSNCADHERYVTNKSELSEMLANRSNLAEQREEVFAINGLDQLPTKMFGSKTPLRDGDCNPQQQRDCCAVTSSNAESGKQSVPQCQKSIQQLLSSNGTAGVIVPASVRKRSPRKRKAVETNDEYRSPVLSCHLQSKQTVSGMEQPPYQQNLTEPMPGPSSPSMQHNIMGNKTAMSDSGLCPAYGNNVATASGGIIRGPVSSRLPVPCKLSYMCEWNRCGRLFTSAQAVCNHVYKEHIGEVSQQCKWPNCDNTVRLKWSLVAHVQDVHCTELALRTAATRRFEIATTGQSSIPEPRPPPPHPGYAPDAAMAAIRRHSLVNASKDIMEENEGPVTKSIRITSALILRNLAHYSVEARRKLRSNFGHLANLACSRLDCRKVLSQCLGELGSFSEENSLPSVADWETRFAASATPLWQQ